MKERPILFSGAMVRALLDGRKTQTRRVMKKQPYISRTNPPQFSDVEVGDLFICPDYCPTTPVRGSVIAECKSIGTYHCMGQKTFAEKHSPYGVPGDHLWVRESFWGCDMPGWGDQPCVVYEDEWRGKEYHAAEVRPYARRFGHIPGIHMPRDASRITLEVTGVRIERLQDISEADAIAEGLISVGGPLQTRMWEYSSTRGGQFADPRVAYRCLWDSLNSARGYGWDVNPWVWVVEFKRISSEV